MKKLSDFLVGHRMPIIITFCVLLLVSIWLSTKVEVNYDMSRYLPDDMNTSRALEIVEEEFGLSGSARLMVKNVTQDEAAALKPQLAAVEGVKSVSWMDDFAPLAQLGGIDLETLEDSFYKDNCALFTIQFTEDNYSSLTADAIDELLSIGGEEAYASGPAMNAKFMREGSSSDVLRIILICIPIILLILVLTMTSWFEPILLIVTIGVSVVINMGTNAFMTNISFITQMCMAVLQFAITMDYSIFLLHRFSEERGAGLEPVDAMKKALSKSASTLLASCLTTVAGFVSIMFMRYRIGFDVGFVLAKGVIISLICVIALLPALILLTEKVLDKGRHKPFIPPLTRFGKLTVKLRFVILPIFILLLIPAIYGQQNANFLYGESALSSSEGSVSLAHDEEITSVFGKKNDLVIIVPAGDSQSELQLSIELNQIDNIDSIQSLPLLIPSSIPLEYVPASYKREFQSENYSRIMLNIAAPEESEESLTAVEEVGRLTGDYYDEYYLLGQSSSVYDIKDATSSDYTVVTIILIGLVLLILIITFKSLALPVILVFVIQGAIFINMAVPYFGGGTLIFLGYMIVSSLQLGATIDYAILLTKRYIENRESMGKKEAAIKAVSDSGLSIITSAGILTAAGFTVGFASSLDGIAQLGILIGRGALLSGLTVLIILPQLLVVADRILRIRKKPVAEND